MAGKPFAGVAFAFVALALVAFALGALALIALVPVGLGVAFPDAEANSELGSSIGVGLGCMG